MGITAALHPVGSDGFYSSEIQWVETKKNQHAEPYDCILPGCGWLSL